MKKLFIVMSFVSAAAFLAAQGGFGKGVNPAKILEAAPSAADKTEEELTLGEKIAIASAASVSKQEKAYVRRAAMASFILPGAGQIKTGDYAMGAVHLGAQAAIIGGTAAALWFLAPEELLDFSGTRDERRDAMRAYMTKDRVVEILPAIGVAAGGAALSLVNSALAARGAKSRAMANIAGGKISFEPSVSMAGGMPSIGLKCGLR